MNTERPIEFIAKNESELTIRASAEPRTAAAILLAAEAWAVKNSLPQQCRLDIQLCIDELFSNICRYAKIPKCSENSELPVSVALKKENATVVLVLSDIGKEFNPMEISPPDLTTSVEKRPIGGLGFFLVRSVAKKTEYFYKEGRNIIELVLDAAG